MNHCREPQRAPHQPLPHHGGCRTKPDTALWALAEKGVPRPRGWERSDVFRAVAKTTGNLGMCLVCRPSLGPKHENGRGRIHWFCSDGSQRSNFYDADFWGYKRPCGLHHDSSDPSVTKSGHQEWLQRCAWDCSMSEPLSAAAFACQKRLLQCIWTRWRSVVCSDLRVGVSANQQVSVRLSAPVGLLL